VSGFLAPPQPVFHGKKVPKEGRIVGYAAIIEKLRLPMTMVQTIPTVCDQNKGGKKEGWLVIPIRYLPIDEDISEIELFEAILRFQRNNR